MGFHDRSIFIAKPQRVFYLAPGNEPPIFTVKPEVKDRFASELTLPDPQNKSKRRIIGKNFRVLMNADGMPAPQIAKTIKRNPHTVRDRLKKYNVRYCKVDTELFFRKISPQEKSS